MKFLCSLPNDEDLHFALFLQLSDGAIVTAPSLLPTVSMTGMQMAKPKTDAF
jgi:hypothetical protein